MGVPQSDGGGFTNGPLSGAVVAFARNPVDIALPPLWTRRANLCGYLLTLGTGADSGEFFVAHGEGNVSEKMKPLNSVTLEFNLHLLIGRRYP